MKKNPVLGKHSHNNRETKEGAMLRLIREVRKLSQIDVAQLINSKSIEVDHFENGRKFVTDAEIETFLKCYNVSKKDFDTLMSFKVINRQIVQHFVTQSH